MTWESYDELDELLCAYAEDDAVAFTYTKALAAFRRRDDDAGSRGLLARAREQNPHIPVYLMGCKEAARAASRVRGLR